MNGKNVICLFYVLAGKLKKNIALNSCAFHKTYQLFDVGVLQPELNPQEELTPGQIGYAISNMKEVKEARIGDTFFKVGTKVDPEPGFAPSKPMLFAGVYPLDPDEYGLLEKKYVFLYFKSLEACSDRPSSRVYTLKQCHFGQWVQMWIFRTVAYGCVQAKTF